MRKPETDETDDEPYLSELLSEDTDGDGVSDVDEITELGTDPSSKDTDKDGWTDAEEAAVGTDPLDYYDNPLEQ